MQLPPVGDEVTVYDEGVPPLEPAATIIVTPPSAPVTEENVGAVGALIFHCAIKVEFVPLIVVA